MGDSLVAGRARRRPDGVALVAIATSFAAPGASYLFTWPLLFALVAARSGREIAWWLAVAVTLLLLAGLAYTIAAIMLGVAGPGSAVLAVVTALIVWLCAPLVMRAGGGRRRSWPLPAALAGAAVVFAIIGATTRAERRHADPERVGVRAKRRRRRRAARITRGDERLDPSVLGPMATSLPAWASALRSARFSAKPQSRATLERRRRLLCVTR